MFGNRVASFASIILVIKKKHHIQKRILKIRYVYCSFSDVENIDFVLLFGLLRLGMRVSETLTKNILSMTFEYNFFRIFEFCAAQMSNCLFTYFLIRFCFCFWFCLFFFLSPPFGTFQISFAMKAKQMLWHDSQHFAMWCRYGDRQQDIRRRQVVETQNYFFSY